MLIRYIDNFLPEILDELAIKILADPSDDGNLLELDTHSVNIIVHGAIGTFCEPDKSFEENIEYIMNKYFTWEPRPHARKDAIELIKRYHVEIKDEDIGMFPADDMI